jgi:hypothetical protein
MLAINLRTTRGRCWSIIFCILSGPAALHGLSCRTIQAISEWFVAFTRSACGCLGKSLTTCSLFAVKERSTSEFVVKVYFKLSAKAFNFSWIAVTVFPLMVRGGILGLVFVKLLVTLQVSCVVYVYPLQSFLPGVRQLFFNCRSYLLF